MSLCPQKPHSTAFPIHPQSKQQCRNLHLFDHLQLSADTRLSGCSNGRFSTRLPEQSLSATICSARATVGCAALKIKAEDRGRHMRLPKQGMKILQNHWPGDVFSSSLIHVLIYLFLGFQGLGQESANDTYILPSFSTE